MKTYKIDNQYGPLEERVKNLEDYLQRMLRSTFRQIPCSNLYRIKITLYLHFITN